MEESTCAGRRRSETQALSSNDVDEDGSWGFPWTEHSSGAGRVGYQGWWGSSDKRAFYDSAELKTRSIAKEGACHGARK